MIRAYFFILNLMGWFMLYKVQILACVVAILLMTSACSQLNKYLHVEDDWWGEELLEDEIKKETGLDFDLTPSSIEIFSKDF